MNKEKCLISIVVPVYNVESYLDRCVSSIVHQTYSNLEILLIDDGSPDRCPQMCDEWAKKDSRIKVIHKQNAGLGMARNTGIEHAMGEYICFFDSDDYVAEDLIEKTYRTIAQTQADIVLYGYTLADPERDFYQERIPDPNKEMYEKSEVLLSFLPEFLGQNPKTGKNSNIPVGACAAMYSMELIRRANWRFASEREIISEDTYSHLVLYKDVGKVAVLKECLYYYCVNGTSLTRTYRSDRFEKIKYFYERCLKVCEDYRYPSEVIRRCAEPFVGYTIAALKQEAAFSAAPDEGIRRIVGDPVLQEVLQAKRKDRDNIKKKLLFLAIRNKWYGVVKLMLLAQNRIK